MNLIKYGWLVYDLVDVEKTWCPSCCKQRVHEKYRGWLICLGDGCGYQTEPVAEIQPPFQVERFLKEELNNEGA